jgi:PAS domain S-box-containing protein
MISTQIFYRGISSKIRQWLKALVLAITLIILIVLSLPTTVCAAESRVQFEHITADQGLSQSGVLCILQDSQGFMWFGTQDGLNKYDGYNFTVYKYNKLNLYSLSDNFISSIYEDKLGTIWVGTDGGGLNKFDRTTEKFTRYTHNLNDPNSLGANRVLSIYEDKLGTIWVGTDGGGLNKFDRKTEKFTHYLHNPIDPDSLGSDTVFAINEDHLGNLWVGTGSGGLNKFNRDSETFSHYVHDLDDPNSLSHNSVLAIYEDQSSRLWIGTNGGGLNRFNRDTETFSHYTHNPTSLDGLGPNTVSSIAEDKFGNLWVGTSSWYGNSYGTGLHKFSPQTGRFSYYTHEPANSKSLNDNIVGPIFKDNTEILWIGTAFGGINKLDQKDQKFIRYKNESTNHNSLTGNHIMSMDEDISGLVWIGTANGGLNKFDPKNEKFTHYKHEPNNPNSISSNNIWSTYEDKNGVLWIGTFGNGLDKFDRKTGHFTHYKHNPNNSNSLSDDTVSSIYEDSFGTLWIGTFSGGINKFDRKSEKFTHYKHDPSDPNSLSDSNIWLIYEDKSGTLWFSCYGQGGLNEFNRKTEQFTRYKHDPNNPNSLSYDRIDAIYEDRKGTLWVGTYGGGLNKFDKFTNKFTHYTVKDGLPNDSIIGILEDEAGNLWLSTGKGLSKFNPKTEIFRNYDVDDGLQGNEFDGVKAYLKSRTGEMFFGGLNGFNAFYPEQVKDNPHIPPIVLTNFKKFNESVKLDTAISETKEVKLSYKDNFFGFEFAALDYTNPKKNQYAYKLEGFDKDWIHAGTRRYATYTNLDGGTYTFRVKGSNNDGVWNEEGTSIKIIITPPPWKTWWAYMLYVLALVSAVCGYVWWKTRTQARENALLRESERKLNQFLEAIPLGIGVIDTSGKSVYVNQIGLQLHGMEVSPEASIEQLSEAYQVYIAGTDQLYPTEELPLVRALKGEKVTLDDVEIHQPDKIVPLEVLGTPIYDERGAIIYAMAAFQDITPRKQAEAERQEYIEALQEAKDKLQAVLDTVPGCVSWLGSDGRYLGINRYLANIFNTSPDTFVGRELGFLGIDSKFAQFIREFLASLDSTASQVVDMQVNGSTRNYLIAVQKYRHNTAVVSVGIDITERMLAEEALRASLREKEVLLQEVHHRVKNNLQIICSLLDLQSQHLSDRKTQELFRESYNRIRSMALIHEKLYQSKSLEKIDLAEYIETLTSYLLQSYGVNTDSITVNLKVKQVFIKINTAIPCGLIINELVSNSLKYAFPQKVDGLLEISLDSDSKQRLTLTVKDSGIGFPKDLSFQKATTLGLQLVKVLTEQLEGEIELYQDRGTEFRIQFFEVET